MALGRGGRFRFVSQTECAGGQKLVQGAVVLACEAGFVAEDAGELVGFGQHLKGRGNATVVRGEGVVPSLCFSRPGMLLADFRIGHVFGNLRMEVRGRFGVGG